MILKYSHAETMTAQSQLPVVSDQLSVLLTALCLLISLSTIFSLLSTKLSLRSYFSFKLFQQVTNVTAAHTRFDATATAHTGFHSEVLDEVVKLVG